MGRLIQAVQCSCLFRRCYTARRAAYLKPKMKGNEMSEAMTKAVHDCEFARESLRDAFIKAELISGIELASLWQKQCEIARRVKHLAEMMESEK